MFIHLATACVMFTVPEIFKVRVPDGSPIDLQLIDDKKIRASLSNFGEGLDEVDRDGEREGATFTEIILNRFRLDFQLAYLLVAALFVVLRLPGLGILSLVFLVARGTIRWVRAIYTGIATAVIAIWGCARSCCRICCRKATVLGKAANEHYDEAGRAKSPEQADRDKELDGYDG